MKELIFVIGAFAPIAGLAAVMWRDRTTTRGEWLLFVLSSAAGAATTAALCLL